MLRYNKIMFPIDLTENSVKILPHVQAIAAQFNAKIHIVYVAKTVEYYREDDYEWKEKNAKPGQIITQTVTEYVDKYFSILEDPKVVVLDGDPVPELHRYIKDEGIDLVVMPASKKTALGKVIFGSVAGDFLRNAHVPVFSIRPDFDKFLK